MSKSIYVLAGLGLLGCLALGLIMQHLLRVQVDRDRSEIAIELQEMCGNQLDGPVVVALVPDAPEPTMVVKVSVGPDVEPLKFARSASSLVWRIAHRHDQAPEHLHLEVRPPDQAEPVVVRTSRSSLSGLRRPLLRRSRVPAAPPAGGK